MKNKPILSVANFHFDILKYLRCKKSAKWADINKKNNLKGSGIFLTQLENKGLIEKISRGTYKITKLGKQLVNVLLKL